MCLSTAMWTTHHQMYCSNVWKCQNPFNLAWSSCHLVFLPSLTYPAHVQCVCMSEALEARIESESAELCTHESEGQVEQNVNLPTTDLRRAHLSLCPREFVEFGRDWVMVSESVCTFECFRSVFGVHPLPLPGGSSPRIDRGQPHWFSNQPLSPLSDRFDL
jgi:hypothetical protein